MQYLENIKLEQEYNLENWQFGHVNRIHHEPWERQARKLRNRRSKEIRKQERIVHKQLRKEDRLTHTF